MLPLLDRCDSRYDGKRLQLLYIIKHVVAVALPASLAIEYIVSAVSSKRAIDNTVRILE
jgi:hypothetical protein